MNELPDALRPFLATLAEGSRQPVTALAGELHGLLELGERIPLSDVRDMIPTLCERKHYGRQGDVPKQRAQLNDYEDADGGALLVWETVNLALAADHRTAFEANRKARKEVEKRVKVLDKLLAAIDGGDVDRINTQREKWREFEIQEEKLRAKEEVRKQKDEERKRLQEEAARRKLEENRQREEKKKQELEEKEEKRRRKQEEKDKEKEEREKAAEEERDAKRRKQSVDNDMSSEKEPRKRRAEVQCSCYYRSV